MITTQKPSPFTVSAARTAEDTSLKNQRKSSSKEPIDNTSPSLTDSANPSQISFVDKVPGRNMASKTESARHLPFPATGSGKSAVKRKQLLDVAREGHSKGLPVVFVVEAELSEKLENGAPTLGDDFLSGPTFLSLKMDDEAEDIHDTLRNTKSILLVLFNGDCKEISTSTLKENDPEGLFTEALLAINVTTPSHRFNDAEERVTVAAALCLGTFGFIDTSLAEKILSPKVDPNV